MFLVGRTFFWSWNLFHCQQNLYLVNTNVFVWQENYSSHMIFLLLQKNPLTCNCCLKKCQNAWFFIKISHEILILPGKILPPFPGDIPPWIYESFFISIYLCIHCSWQRTLCRLVTNLWLVNYIIPPPKIK